jgi:hypothetical protein
MTKLLTTTAVILAVFAAVPAQAATSGKGLIRKDPTRGDLVRVALVKKVIKKHLIRTPRKELAVIQGGKERGVEIVKEAVPATAQRRAISQ